jgi:phage gpG-like protein
MIKTRIVGTEATVENIRQIAPKVGTALDQKIAELTISLLTKVKAEKLRGQVLKVRDGRLWRSINQRVTGKGTNAVTGTVGTNVVYAGVHEYGFNGVVSVKEHLRMQKMAWGKSIFPKQVTVRAHQMHMNMPERSFLRSALAEMRPEILEQIKQAVDQGLKS